MATANRSNAKREPASQKPGTDRNKALANLAISASAEESAPKPAPVGLPRHSGRTRDFGGTVEAVVVTPWISIEGDTLFRGDHVLAKASVVDGTDALVRV